MNPKKTAVGTIALGAVASFTGAFLLALPAGASPSSTAKTNENHAVGNYLDGLLGGRKLDALATLQYAKADLPGTTTQQDPLNATALQSINANLTNTLQLPTLLGLQAGAASQTAQVKSATSARGYAGTVQNNGGVSVGGRLTPKCSINGSAAGSLTLSASTLTGSVDVPGGGNADALGEVNLCVGAVSATASTNQEGAGTYGDSATKESAYTLQGLNVDLTSPLLASILGNVNTQVTPTLTPLNGLAAQLSALLPGTSLPAACAVGAVTDPLTNLTTKPFTLENGAVSVDPTTGTLSIDTAKLLTEVFNKDLNKLPANTNLTAFLVDYLTNPDGLTKSLSSLVTNAGNQVQTHLDTCASALTNLGSTTQALATGITNAGTALDNALSPLTTALNTTGFSSIGNALSKLVSVGVNVQQVAGSSVKANALTSPTSSTFKSNLAATPKQGTNAPAGQAIERAVEVDVLGPRVLALSLANAAAGPSVVATPVTPTGGGPTGSGSPTPTGSSSGSPSSNPTGTSNGSGNDNNGGGNSNGVGNNGGSGTGTSNGTGNGTTQVPTAVDSGQGVPTRDPLVPLLLLIGGLLLAGGGATAWKLQNGHVA